MQGCKKFRLYIHNGIRNMKDYELHARKYPAIVAMLIPAALTSYLLLNNFPNIIGIGNIIIESLAYFVPIAIIYAIFNFKKSINRSKRMKQLQMQIEEIEFKNAPIK